MKDTNKNRRSPRIAARHNIMLMVEAQPDGQPSKEVVTTMHISRHGAHLIGRRAISENSRGRLAHLTTCKQAPFRIAWQAPSKARPGFHEMGIEFEEMSDFWGASFAASDKSSPAASAEAEGPSVPKTNSSASGNEETARGAILDQLRAVPPGPDGREITDAIWCGLVEQLEERRVISRGELIASLRKVGLQL